MSPLVTVRRARLADAEAIASIHVTAWQEAYSHLVGADRLAALNPADRVARWREIVVGTDETTWIAERDGVPVGWATTSERNGTTEPRGLQVNGIYRRNGFSPDGAADQYELQGTPVAIVRWVR